MTHGASHFLRLRRAREPKGRGRDNLPLVDLWNYIINGGLAERRSTRCDRRQWPALETVHSRPVPSPRPLGIECPLCVGQRSHGRARWPAAPGHYAESSVMHSNVLPRMRATGLIRRGHACELCIITTSSGTPAASPERGSVASSCRGPQGGQVRGPSLPDRPRRSDAW